MNVFISATCIENVHHLILYFKLLQAPETNWALVVDNFDYEGFYLPDQKAFNTLLGIYGRACEVFIW